MHYFLQQLLSDSVISKDTSDAAIGRYIYNEVWRAFPNSDLKWALNQYLKTGNPSKQHQKNLDDILRGTIKAKLLALLAHHLLVGFPLEESSTDFWPPYALLDDDQNGQAYESAHFTRYFISRAVAIILRHDIMDFVLFQFVGTDVQMELNRNAHLSGIDSHNEEETRRLLGSAANILDNHLTVKTKLATFQGLFDIVASHPIDRQCPLSTSMIRRATSPLDSCGYGDHGEYGDYDHVGDTDYNVHEDYDENYNYDLGDNNFEHDDEEYHRHASDYERGPSLYEPYVEGGVEERSAATLGLDVDETDESRASSSYYSESNNPSRSHEFDHRRKRRRETP